MPCDAPAAAAPLGAGGQRPGGRSRSPTARLGAGGFEALLARLAENHRREVAELATLKDDFVSLREENTRLAAELGRRSGFAELSPKSEATFTGEGADAGAGGWRRQFPPALGDDAAGWCEQPGGLRIAADAGTSWQLDSWALPGTLEERPVSCGELAEDGAEGGGRGTVPMPRFSTLSTSSLKHHGTAVLAATRLRLVKSVRIAEPGPGPETRLGEPPGVVEPEGGQAVPRAEAPRHAPTLLRPAEASEFGNSECSDDWQPAVNDGARSTSGMTMMEPEDDEEAGRELLDQLDVELDTNQINKQKRRFRNVLKLGPGSLSARDLMRSLERRHSKELALDKAERIMSELGSIGARLLQNEDTALDDAKPPVFFRTNSTKSSNQVVRVDFDMFVRLICWKQLPMHVDPDLCEDVSAIQNTLLSKDVEEVVATVSRTHTKQRSTSIPSLGSLGSTGFYKELEAKRIAMLNAFVGLTIILSIVVLGLSMDHAPFWIGWIILEAVFASVFIMEMIIKTWILGAKNYLWSENWQWNWLDVVITLTTLIDLTISLSSKLSDNDHLSVAKLTLVLRALRLTRIARLVKLLRTPILAELANMLAGFLIGVPCMLWVLVFLTLIFFTLGMIFRSVIGPESGVSYVEGCGAGDELPISTPECKLHYLYGEEFFGTVWQSMFTVFRCVLGDCTTKRGQSLTTHFSQGYGFYFDVTYCVGMVVVMFGLFNIITAIFVESTISGLKFNDVQRKYARMYELRYVQWKLRALVMRIRTIREDGQDHATVCSEKTDYADEAALSEQDFNRVIGDGLVKNLLDDLGVSMDDNLAHRLFEMLDVDQGGMITICDLVDTLMTVRGELTKSDMITSWVAIRSLKEEFLGFKKYMKVMLENQIRMQESLKTPVLQPTVSAVATAPASNYRMERRGSRLNSIQVPARRMTRRGS